MKIDYLTLQQKLDGNDKYRGLMGAYTNLKVMLFLANDISNEKLGDKYTQLIEADIERVRKKLMKFLKTNFLDITPTKRMNL